MDATTVATGFAGRIPAVNIVNQLALFAGHVFQNFQERAKSQVAHLPAPEPFHSAQVQRLEKQNVIAVSQDVGQLEKPVGAPVLYFVVDYRQLVFGLAPAVRKLFAPGKVAVSLANFGQRLLEKQRRFYRVGFKSIVDSQKGFEAEIKPRHFTGRGGERRLFHFLGRTQVEITHPAPLNCDCFDRAGQLPLFDKLVDLASNLGCGLSPVTGQNKW